MSGIRPLRHHLVWQLQSPFSMAMATDPNSPWRTRNKNTRQIHFYCVGVGKYSLDSNRFIIHNATILWWLFQYVFDARQRGGTKTTETRMEIPRKLQTGTFRLLSFIIIFVIIEESIILTTPCKTNAFFTHSLTHSLHSTTKNTFKNGNAVPWDWRRRNKRLFEREDKTIRQYLHCLTIGKKNSMKSRE